MAYAEDLDVLVATIRKRADACKTEEATKMGLIVPMLQNWGYDPFNPLEVVPEYTADAPIKKNEKVDYAIMNDGEPIILIECKPYGASLDKYGAQLFRYFSCCPAKIGILTNGSEYRFFSDTQSENKMDMLPFLTIDIFDLKPGQADQLKKFCRSEFNLEALMPSIEALALKRNIRNAITKAFENPPEDIIRYFVGEVYSGKMVTKKVISEYAPLIRDGLKSYINDIVTNRLQNAINGSQENEETEVSTDGIITTEEEIQGHQIVQAIASEIVPVERVAMKDAKSYCTLFFDRNSRRPILRMYFNTANKKIATFEDGKENIVPISKVADIYSYKNQILETIKKYLE